MEKKEAMNMAICDQCNVNIQRDGGFIFYSSAGLGSPGKVKETGNMFLCEQCTNKICTPTGFADWSSTISESDVNAISGDPKKLMIYLGQKNNAIGIAAVCNKHGLTPEQAKDKARELALLFWQDPEKAQMESVKFWSPEIHARLIAQLEKLDKSKKNKRWWKFWG
jgi:hypothetical protein